MSKTLAIAAVTLRLVLRNGGALSLVFLAMALGSGIFFAARGDGTLAHELQMRLRYGLYFATGLINFALMYIGCISLRRDLDQRHFHLISAAPVHRAQIWLGKYLGLMILGAAAHLGTALALTICCLAFAGRWEPPADRATLPDRFLQAWAVHRPDQPPVEDLVEREFRRRLAESHHHEDDADGCDDPGHHHGEPEWFIRQELVKEVRRSLQMVPPDTPKTWRFNLDATRVDGEDVRLQGKFYSEQKRILVEGDWDVAAPGQPPTWTGAFSGYAFLPFEIRIPRALMPPGPVVELTFRGRNTPHLIFPVNEADGVRLLTGQGTIASNYPRLLLASLLHLGLLLALAMALAAMFSYSVAVFVTMAAYFISMAADSFLTAMRFQMFGERNLIAHAIRAALSLGRGLQSPAAIEPFANGIALPLGELMNEWGIAAATATAVVAAIGIVVLTRKEIDKLLQS
jgi:hypothetical protein